MLRLLISTGEVSGDLQGSLLIKALYREASRRSLNLEVIALGGSRMEASGAKLLANTSRIGSIGIWEALPYILPTLKIQSKLDKFFSKNPPDAVVLIDYMGPNIRIGNKFRRKYADIPITYYIAPQEWAWKIGEDGTTDLISFSDQILAIFKAEADFYASRGGKVSWIGHPMLDTIKSVTTQKDALKHLGLESNQKVLLLFPASRSQELYYLLPTLLKAAAVLQSRDPSIYVIIPSGLKSFEETLKMQLIEEGVNGRVIPASENDSIKHHLFCAATLALGKSGTINMELALNNVPQIAAYKVSRVTAFLARRLLKFKVEHISPVNLMLNERLIPELVQENFTTDALVSSATKLMYDEKLRSSMLDGYTRLKEKLGDPGVTDRAAKKILDLIH